MAGTDEYTDGDEISLSNKQLSKKSEAPELKTRGVVHMRNLKKTNKT